MIILFDMNHNKLSPLTSYKEYFIERELTGNETLSFLYPLSMANINEIKEECYLQTPEQEYVIKEVNDSGEWISIVAKVNLEDLKGKTIDRHETVNTTLTNATNLALAGTDWTITHNDITRRRTVRKANCSVFEVIEEIRKIYRAEVKYDAINKTISFYESMGNNKGAYFTEDLNLRQLSSSSSSYDFCTRIVPIGKDGLKITDINNGKDYVENYQYSNKVISLIWEDNRYIDVESLKEDAIAKLNELSKPVKSYSADVIDLAKLNETYKDILDYNLGDTITLISKDKSIKEKQRIVKITEYPDESERNAAEIANRTPKFEDMQTEVLEATDTVDEVTTSDGFIDDSKINFNPIRQEFGTIISEKADITDLNSATARIGTLETTKADITDLNASNARIGTLETDHVSTRDLNATNAKIDNIEIDTGQIKDLAVTNAKIADATIEGAKIANATVTTANIELGAITTALIDDGAINTAQIADGSITDAKIVELTANKITSGELSTERLIIRDPQNPKNSLIYEINNIDGALQAVQGDTLNGEVLTKRSITADKIVAESITAGEIASETILANNIASNAITADKIHSDSILARHIKAGEITTDKVESNFGSSLNLESNTAIIAKVSKDNIINDINLSPEGLKINANRLVIGAGTSFENSVDYTWEQYADMTWQQVINDVFD